MSVFIGCDNLTFNKLVNFRLEINGIIIPDYGKV